MNTKLKLIIVWQVIIVFFSIVSIVSKVQTDQILHNRIMYMDHETWSEGVWYNVPWYPDYYQEFKDIEAIIQSLYILSVVPIAIAGCIGLLLKSNWGRISTIISMGMTSIYLIFSLVSISLLQPYEIDNVFIDVVAIILVRQAFIVLSILSLLYLNRLEIKELYKSKSISLP